VLAASRLETRRFAAMSGATLELEKGEGLAFDPETRRVYLAISSLRRRTGAEPDEPVDGLRLPDNVCGAVAALDTASGARDTAGNPIASEMVAARLALAVQGIPLPDGACDPQGIANPDNLAFLAGYGVLAIAEDTGRHANARLWAFDTRSPGASLTSMVIAPPDGEVTGIQWIPDLYGHAYLTLAIQHPWARLAELPEGERPADAAERMRSFTGYIGPFPTPGTRGLGP
jgi:secreted PhoX family phosphatase